MSYIEVKKVTKTIKGNHILENINLNLEKGNIYGFVVVMDKPCYLEQFVD